MPLVKLKPFVDEEEARERTVLDAIFSFSPDGMVTAELVVIVINMLLGPPTLEIPPMVCGWCPWQPYSKSLKPVPTESIQAVRVVLDRLVKKGIAEQVGPVEFCTGEESKYRVVKPESFRWETVPI